MNNPSFDDSMLVSADEFKKTMTDLCAWVRDSLADDPDTSWTPTLIVLNLSWPKLEREVHLYVLDVDFNEDEEKHALLYKIARTLYEAKKVPIAAFLTAEAWQSCRREGSPRMQPRDDPNRQEIIMVAGLTLGRKLAAMNSLPIRRDHDNRIVPGEFGDLQTQGVESRLLNELFTGFANSIGSLSRN